MAEYIEATHLRELLGNATFQLKILNSLERGEPMTVWDKLYDFNVMYYDFSEGARGRLCKNYFWYFN